MEFKTFVLVLLVQLIKTSTAIPSLPSKCWLWDSPCLIGKAQTTVPILAAGVPELGIQPLETILIDFIHIEQEGLKADLRRMSVKGLGDGVIDNVSVDIPTRIINVVFHTDLEVKSRYINNGTLFSSPISGDGNFFMKIENVEIAMNILFDIIKDAHDKELMILKSYEYTFNVRSGVQFRFENLYSGNKDLSEIMHEKMHKNWKFLTVLYGRYLFDPLTKKVFSAVRNYVQSEPMDNVCMYVFK